MSALYKNYVRSDIAFERGEGVRLFSTQGDEYFDFSSGIAVNLLGHADPHVVAATKQQVEKLWHVSNVFTIPQQQKLAERLTEISFADMVFFTNSGAEANECAIKTARRYFYDKGETDRFEIITMEGAFHGRTLGTIAAGGNPSYLEGFGPKAAGFVQVPFADLKALEKAITAKTAGVFFEPVQGESGIHVLDAQFMRDVRALCDKHGILLMLDEIQCGYGRTGKMFAYEWAGIKPDIMALAKGIGGGFPLGACLATEEVGKAMVPGTHGSTYGGNPLACAVGNAVLDRVLAPGFLEQVAEVGAHLFHSLNQLMQKYPQLIQEMRGKGLMCGLKVAPAVGDVVAAFRLHKIITVAAGDNVVRLLPPLITTKDDVDEAIRRMDAGLKSLVS